MVDILHILKASHIEGWGDREKLGCLKDLKDEKPSERQEFCCICQPELGIKQNHVI